MKPGKQSTRQIVFAAIFFAFCAGFQTALGIVFLRERNDLHGLGYLAVAFGFCIVAGKYALDLLEGHQPGDQSTSHRS
jgi:hypothetical protein